MSQIIGGLFAVTVLAIAGILFFGVNLSANVAWGYELDQKMDRLANRIQTVVNIDAAEGYLMEGGNSTIVTATLQNRGAAPAGNFDGMHLLVMYTDVSGQKIINRLIHVDYYPPATNQWAVNDILPDTFEPGILNPGEHATLSLVLEPAVEAGAYGTLFLSTTNGATASGVFSNSPAE